MSMALSGRLSGTCGPPRFPVPWTIRPQSDRLYGRRPSLLGSSSSRWGIARPLRSADCRCRQTPSGLPCSAWRWCDRVGCLLYAGVSVSHSRTDAVPVSDWPKLSPCQSSLSVTGR